MYSDNETTVDNEATVGAFVGYLFHVQRPVGLAVMDEARPARVESTGIL